MRITLLHNPKAGRKEHRKKDLLAAIAEAGHRVTYQSSKQKRWKKVLKKPTDLVLVAGGDGTVGKVAAHLVETGIPLAVLPLGTANNLARTFGFHAPVNQIINGLATGIRHEVDVGVASGACGKRYFFESAGGGVLADYVKNPKTETKSKKTKQLSKSKEMTRHVSALFDLVHDYRSRRWKIEIDGEDISDRYLLWEAMNIRSVGPALYLAPLAHPKDGQFDFVSARESDRSRLLEYLDARLAGKKIDYPLPFRRFQSVRLRWKGATLHFDDKLWPRIDEIPKGKNIEITVKPAALLILIPAETKNSS